MALEQLTGNEIRKLRERSGLNQLEFWRKLEVSQSGGSRYETGRTMPRPIRRLRGLVYLGESIKPFSMPRKSGSKANGAR